MITKTLQNLYCLTMDHSRCLMSAEEASSLLIKAFCQDPLNFIKEKLFLIEVDKLINKWLLKYVN